MKIPALLQRLNPIRACMTRKAASTDKKPSGQSPQADAPSDLCIEGATSSKSSAAAADPSVAADPIAATAQPSAATAKPSAATAKPAASPAKPRNMAEPNAAAPMETSSVVTTPPRTPLSAHKKNPSRALMTPPRTPSSMKKPKMSSVVMTPPRTPSYATPAYVHDMVDGKTEPPTDPPDVQAFLSRLSRLAAHLDLSAADERAAAALFSWKDPVMISRAPGRLDVMGGIADYSGSLVLEMPIAEATFVAVQLQPHRDDVRLVSLLPCGSATDRSAEFSIKSYEVCGGKKGKSYKMPWDKKRIVVAPPSLSALGAALRTAVGRHTEWVGYVLGCLAALVDERKVSLAGGGLSILVSSDVPESKGVASSAALEVATMRALGALFGLEIHGRELALLCQRVENEVSVVVDVYVQVHADKFAHVCVSCASICLSRTPFPLANPKSPI